MSAPPASAGPSIADLVLEAESAIIRCLYSAVVHDPFWESITIRFDGPDLTIAVVNLVEYEPHSRSSGEFGAELLHPVHGEIEFLRGSSCAAGETPGRAHPGIVTVYRDSVSPTGEPARLRVSPAA
jgi:hypothetical protein